MKKIIFLLILFCSIKSMGQITNAYYTNKGATVPYINSSVYKLNGYDLDSANTVKRGFFTPTQYKKLKLLREGTYSEIYVTDGATAQSIPTGTTYEKSTAFTTNGISSNCTANAGNDKITITKIGKYLVNGNVSFFGDISTLTWRGNTFLGGVKQDNIHWERKVTAYDINAVSFTGIINVTTVPVDIDLRLRHSNGASANITIVHSNINIILIGE